MFDVGLEKFDMGGGLAPSSEINWRLQIFIHIAPLADALDSDDQFFILDCVNYPILSDSDSI